MIQTSRRYLPIGLRITFAPGRVSASRGPRLDRSANRANQLAPSCATRTAARRAHAIKIALQDLLNLQIETLEFELLGNLRALLSLFDSVPSPPLKFLQAQFCLRHQHSIAI